MSKQSVLPTMEGQVSDRELLTERLELRVPPSLRKEILALVGPGRSMNKVVLTAVRAGLPAIREEVQAA